MVYGIGQSVKFYFVYDIFMTRKYTKRNKAYWNSKGKVKITRNNSGVIMKDKGKHSTVTVVAKRGQPVYYRKSV
jgi:hypothetical protein